MLSQGRYLHSGVAGPGQVQSHLLHQHIRRRGQQHPERVRQEARATGPADLHSVVQFLDPILDFAPLTVGLLVNPLGGLICTTSCATPYGRLASI
jgi:hypothetical protein